MPKYDGAEPSEIEIQRIRQYLADGRFDDLGKDLQRWVCHRLMPSLTRYGVYPPPSETASPKNPGYCETMQRPKSECGCPDCGPSLIDWPTEEANKPARLDLHLVWNPERENGVVFLDKADAIYASTGRYPSTLANFPGIDSLADYFRDDFEDDHGEAAQLPLVQVTAEIDPKFLAKADPAVAVAPASTEGEANASC
ncbi:hypothetical protein ACSVIJ_04940 [Pseudomonas sp. NCHU5208]|uniref:hypothetical protein n=1 Tax=unclassified Pseudomonas TaxID=196821 RepID=UPI003F958313